MVNAADNSSNECPVCLDEMVNEPKLICNHMLHKVCIEDLRSGGIDKCPLCRGPLKERVKRKHRKAKAEAPLNVQERISQLEEKVLALPTACSTGSKQRYFLNTYRFHICKTEQDCE